MDPFLGQIILFGGNFTIRGFDSCSGQLISISSNTALYSLLGTMYGGDGRVTFALPDLRGRSAVGQGTGPGLSPVMFGQRRGHETTTLTVLNMPSHNHAVDSSNVTVSGGVAATTTAGTTTTPGAGSVVPAKMPTVGSGPGATPVNGYGNNDNTASLPLSITNLQGLTTQYTGNGQSFYNLPPQLGLSYQIAMVGVYPSRN